MLPLFARAGAAMIPGASQLPFVGGGAAAARSRADARARGASAIDRDRLAAYDRVCGFPLRDALPATYPHILAFPLHLALMTDSRLPVPGARPGPHLQPDRPAPPDPRDRASRCRSGCGRPRSSRTRGARQFSLRTEARVGRGARVGGGLDEPAGAARAPRGRRPRPERRAADPRTCRSTATWRLPGDLGRRYGVGLGRHQPDPHAPAERAAVRVPVGDRPRDVDEGPLPGGARPAAARQLHASRSRSASRSCCRRRCSSARPREPSGIRVRRARRGKGTPHLDGSVSCR